MNSGGLNMDLVGEMRKEQELARARIKYFDQFEHYLTLLHERRTTGVDKRRMIEGPRPDQCGEDYHGG